MTDLHCHILPGMDDGAKDTAVSLELLRREYEDGVRNIAFTSHFNSERTTVEAFTVKRQTAFEQLTAALEGQPMQFDFKLGAEVFFSPGLCELDTRALCMGDTAYLLLEFPTTHKPHFIRSTQSFSLGTMLYYAQNGSALNTGAWWWFLPPGLMIAIIGAGLSFINFSIDEVINPRLRKPTKKSKGKKG